MQPGNKPSTMVLVTFTVLLALSVAAAEGSLKDSYSRYLLQAAAATPAAMPGAAAMPAMTNTTMAPANATGNATDDRARRGGGPGGGDGDGRGNTGSTRAVYCGSISCLRRKLFQTPAVSTAPATATETAPAATPAAAPAAATNGLGMLNATMNGTLAGVNVTNGTEADRSRRRNSCSEGACGPPAPRTGFGV